MLHKYLFSLLLLAGLLLSGCFEMVEEVTYKDAQSGTYEMSMNCSKSKARLKALLKLDSFLGVKIPSEGDLNSYFYDAENAVRNTPGISNVSVSQDFQNYIFTFSFSFDKTENLNKAINEAAKACTKKGQLPYYNVFAFSANTFSRNQTPDDSLSKLVKGNPNLKLLAGATATSVYRFAAEVKSVSNSKAIISPNRKAVMLKQSVTDVLANPLLFSNTITLK